MSLFRLKRGVGSHLIRGGAGKGRNRTLRPGDEIECDLSELGNARDKFDVVVPGPDIDPPPIKAKHTLEIVHMGHGRYNVVNPATGQAINTKPLKKKEAREMVSQRQADHDDKSGPGTSGQDDQGDDENGGPAGGNEDPPAANGGTGAGQPTGPGTDASGGPQNSQAPSTSATSGDGSQS